jgi:hypothetical protein
MFRLVAVVSISETLILFTNKNYYFIKFIKAM